MLANFYKGKFTPPLFSHENWFTSLKGDVIFLRKKGAGFVVFEGLDGSGQSTQAELLREHLEGLGNKVILTKEPTIDSEAGRRIKKVLSHEEKLEPETLQELFNEDRKEHLENLIMPALKDGKIVISDRYFFSTFAFGSLGCNFDWLLKINNDFILPDLTFILDVRPEVSIERIKKRGKTAEFFEKFEILKKVREAYKTFPEKFEDVYLIDGEKPISEVFLDVKFISAGKI